MPYNGLENEREQNEQLSSIRNTQSLLMMLKK